MDNQTLANKLKGYARQMEQQQANLYRIKAYRRAAESIERLAIPVAELVRERGAAGLRQVPGIGDHLSFAIECLLATGDFHALHTDAALAPGEDLRSLPGIGPHLAERLWKRLRVRTVTDLERALREHTPEQLPLGAKRRQQLCEALRRRRQEQRQPQPVAGEPGVAELLELDHDYHRLVAEQRLPTIAPEKCNPCGESWLPLYAVRRGGWKYRVMYSNAALAHRLGQTRDWVVIYFSKDTQRGSRTVVTERRGDLRGRRVVRGREAECRWYYDQEITGEDHQAAPGE